MTMRYFIYQGSEDYAQFLNIEQGKKYRGDHKFYHGTCFEQTNEATQYTETVEELSVMHPHNWMCVCVEELHDEKYHAHDT